MSFVDPQSLANALSLFQGSESQSSFNSLNASYTTPSALAMGTSVGSPSNSGSSGAAGASGATGSSGAGGGSTASGGGGSASSPSLQLPTGIQNILANASFAPSFGNSAGDQLSDQINLTYQIFNVRMLLERSLSDRLYNNGTRRQAVLGFNVSIDPAYAERDAAAIVEVTIDDKDTELVGMMPQEKTYNSAALNTHQNAFGGTATARLVTVSLGIQRQSQVFYLFRDNDTLSFQRKAEDSKLRFGWQFRPVLGRKSVSPGMRQMFAIVSLPADDDPGNRTAFDLKVHVRTYWKHYDHNTLTTYYQKPLSKALAMAFSPNNWFIAARGEQKFEFAPVSVLPSAVYESRLGAIVTSASWLRTDETNGTLLIRGQNFFPGTTVRIGPVLFSEGSGLTIQSDQTMILNTSLAAAAQGDGVVTGRYGSAVALAPTAQKPKDIPHLRIDEIQTHPASENANCGAQTVCVDLIIAKTGGLTIEQLPQNSKPTVTYKGVLLTGEQALRDVKNGVQISMRMPASAIDGGSSGVFTVKFPFQGAAWMATAYYYDPLAIDITRVDSDSKSTLMISNGNTAFEPVNGNEWRVILDQVYTVDQPDPRQEHSISLVRVIPCAPKEPGCHILQFTADKSLLDNWKKITILSPSGSLRVFDIPPAGGTPAPGKPALDPKMAMPTVRQGQIRNVIYAGQSLNLVKRVFFNGKDLNFVAASDGKSLTVSLTNDVTLAAGDMQLTLQIDGQNVLSAPLTVLSSQAADAAKKTTQ